MYRIKGDTCRLTGRTCNIHNDCVECDVAAIMGDVDVTSYKECRITGFICDICKHCTDCDVLKHVCS